jgi:hypothetical protein
LTQWRIYLGGSGALAPLLLKNTITIKGGDKKNKGNDEKMVKKE